MKRCANPQCAGHADNDPSIGQSPEHPTDVSGLVLFYIVMIVAFGVWIGTMS